MRVLLLSLSIAVALGSNLRLTDKRWTPLSCAHGANDGIIGEIGSCAANCEEGTKKIDSHVVFSI